MASQRKGGNVHRVAEYRALGSSALATGVEKREVNFAFVVAMGASFLVAYLPTYLKLSRGRVAYRTGRARSSDHARCGLARLAAARQTRIHRISAGARRRMDHPAVVAGVDGGQPFARHTDDRSRRLKYRCCWDVVFSSVAGQWRGYSLFRWPSCCFRCPRRVGCSTRSPFR